MFSFIALARPFGKQTNIYNTLAASVFFLLIYNPYLIMSVGFQLSYLAVLGIVYLQRPCIIYGRLKTGWRLDLANYQRLIAAQLPRSRLHSLFPPVSHLLFDFHLLVVPLSTSCWFLGFFL